MPVMARMARMALTVIAASVEEVRGILGNIALR
jgi:hypothetical protein